MIADVPQLAGLKAASEQLRARLDGAEKAYKAAKREYKKHRDAYLKAVEQHGYCVFCEKGCYQCKCVTALTVSL
jgi:hypothetical protein